MANGELTNRFWDDAIQHVIGIEGERVSTHPSDTGGESKYGISKKRYPTLDIPNLTLEHAKEIYFHDYWVPSYAFLIDSRLLAIKYFDFYINAGPDDAGMCLQQIVNFFEPGSIRVDGVVGKETIRAVNRLLRMRDDQINLIVLGFCARQWDKYFRLVQRNTQLSTFAAGWTRRAFRLPAQA